MYPNSAPPMWANSPPALDDVTLRTLIATITMVRVMSFTSPMRNSRMRYFGFITAVATMMPITDADAPSRWDW